MAEGSSGWRGGRRRVGDPAYKVPERNIIDQTAHLLLLSKVSHRHPPGKWCAIRS